MIRPFLLGIGGAHIDRRGTMSADYIYGASIPGQMIEEAGGGVLNALRTAAQFQIECTLLSVRGGDAAGEMVASELKRAGIADLSSIFLDRATASYTALLERNGNVIAALADMSIYDAALPRQISRRKTRDAIAQSDAILIDANMPENAITHLLLRCEDKPVYALAISPAKAVRLRTGLHRLAGLFLNQREAAAILAIEGNAANHSMDLASKLMEAGLKCCVVTNGADDVCVAHGSTIAMIAPPKTDNVVDVTGAGDAMAGAIIAALLNKMELSHALKHGLAAAALTVQTAKVRADLSDSQNFARMLTRMKP